MNRRKFLAIATASGATGLAGCSGVGGPDPAKLESPSLSGPEVVAYGKKATFTVSVSNAGGKEDTFTATVRSTNEALDFSHEIELTVPPGESAEMETPAVEFPEAGDYGFVLEGPSLTPTSEEEDDTPSETTFDSTSVTVTTVSKSAGDTVTVGNSLRVTMKSVNFLQSVYIGESEPIDVFTAPTGKTLALYYVSLENTGTNSVTWNPSLVSAEGGAFYGQDTPEITNAGQHLGTRRSISPSQSVSGYMLAQFPTEKVKSKAPLTLQVDEASTTPEYRWEFATASTRSFPKLALKDVDAPKQVESGETYDITFTFSNTGDGDGSVKGVLQYSDTNYEDWQKLDTADRPIIEKKVPAGETVKVTVKNSPSAFGETFKYRLIPFNQTVWKTQVE